MEVAKRFKLSVEHSIPLHNFLFSDSKCLTKLVRTCYRILDKGYCIQFDNQLIAVCFENHMIVFYMLE